MTPTGRRGAVRLRLPFLPGRAGAPGRTRRWLPRRLPRGERRRRRGRFRAGAVGVGLCLAVLTGEVLVRLSGATHATRRHFRPGLYAADPVQGWVPRRDYRGVHVEYDREVPTTTNAQGARGPAWDAARARAPVRVLALGDSCTFGRGVPDDATWPARLEARLRARGQAAAAFNAGVEGYDTAQELQALRRRAPLVRPTHVVVVWLANDAHGRPPVQVFDGHLARDRAHYEEWLARSSRRGADASALYRLVRARWKLLEAALGARRDAPPGAPITAAQLASSQAPLAALLAEARALGATPVVVLLPRQEELTDPRFDTSHHARMATFLHGLGVETLDLTRAWREAPPEGPLYLPADAIHLTPAGYDAVARALAATHALGP